MDLELTEREKKFRDEARDWLRSNVEKLPSGDTPEGFALCKAWEKKLFDAAFSLYYFIGFISIPFWTVITGGVMTHYGFGPAFTVISTSYLLAMSLLVLLRTPIKARRLA